MVKPNPNSRDRQSRRRKKFMDMRREALLLNPKMVMNSSSSDHIHLQQQHQTRINTQEITPLTPSPLLMKKRVSRSPSYNSSTYATCPSSSSPPFSDSEDFSSSKKMKTGFSQWPPVCRNWMSLLPPLPPPPSPKLLRRTVSDPVPLLSHSCAHNTTSTSNEKKTEEEVKVEKLSKEWTMLKLKCGCGSHFLFLFNAADNSCFKLV